MTMTGRMDNPPWTVYGLIDPRNGAVFYIGITQNLRRRIAEHQAQPDSAAWEMCQDIAASGTMMTVGCCVFGEFHHRRMAEFLERQLITCIPQTFNRTFLNDGYKLWESIATELGYRQQAEAQTITEDQAIRPVTPVDCPGCSAYRKAKRIAQAKWRAKVAPP